MEDVTPTLPLLEEALRRAYCLVWVSEVTHYSREEKRANPALADQGSWVTTILNEEAAESWLPIVRHPGNSLEQDLFLARSEAAQFEGDGLFAQAFQEGQERCSREFPIRLADGNQLWLHEDVSIQRRGPHRWRLVGVFTDATARKLTEIHLQHEAYHDPLTQLPNRSFFFESLQKQQRPSSRFLLFLDLDNFKLINDTQGHLTGDAVLVEVARRLRQSVGTKGDVVRLGGDEFLILLRPPQTRATAKALAEAILACIKQPFSIEGDLLPLSASIGIAQGSSQEASRWLGNADLAMYAAKSQGRDRVVFFDATMEQDMRQRFELERALRRAVENREITLAYQPIVVLGSGAILGFEGFARWTHATLGTIPPTQFIPLAEELGLIERLGSQLLEEGCHALVGLRQLHPALSLGLNVSVAQLQSQTFAQQGLAMLAALGLPPKCLVLEVTESILAVGQEVVSAQLDALYTAGIPLVMDDFGTGFSSLWALSELPLHALKIDRAFIQRATHPIPTQAERNQALIRAIVSAAQALELLVVLEGIETESQAQLARRLGASLGQGYHFTHPVPLAGALELLRRYPHGTVQQLLRPKKAP